MSYYDEYVKNEMAKALKRQPQMCKFRDDFVNDYPADKINELPISAYLYSGKSTSTFCERIFKNPLASLGNCRTNMFGVYILNGSPMLSPTFKKYPTIEKAYSDVKTLIVNLLDDAKADNFKALDENKLHRAFKLMLLTIYYPEKFMPAPTSTAINAYCKSVGLDLNDKLSPIVKNAKLVRWKNSVRAISNWDTWHLMYFCDILWRKKIFLSEKDFREVIIINNPESIPENPLDDLSFSINVEGEIENNINTTDYFPVPETPSEPISKSSGAVYRRDPSIAAKAIIRANYMCEYDSDHKTFNRKSNGTPYTEAHHLIPISQQKHFKNSLDVQANIVSLCSACHKCIHLGKESPLIIHELYQLRKEGWNTN